MNLPIRVLIACAFVQCAACSTSTPRRTHDGQTHVDERAQEAARFEIAATDLPVLDRKEYRKLRLGPKVDERLVLKVDKTTRLELTLGQRRTVGTNGIYRTESRYRLHDARGRLLAEAESTLAITDLNPDTHPEIVVLSDPARHTYLIAEEQSWATQRYILLRPSRDPGASATEPPTAWSVTYVRIPDLPSTAPVGRVIHVLGLQSDYLYLEQEGHTYKIPLDALTPDPNLSYSIG